jgi:hypothetical protein
MVLWWKSRKAMREKPFYPGRWGFASLYKSGSMRSFLDTEVNREGGREREGRSKRLPGDKVQVGQI